MTLEAQTEWACPACGAKNVSTTWPTVNAKVSPELALRVQDGSLYMVQCVRCSHIGQLNYTAQYHDMAHGRYCMYTSPEQLHRRDDEFMESAAREHWSHYELRCVYDLDSLIELACIWRDNLDDMTMLCVRLMLNRLAKEEQGEGTSVVRYLGQVDGEEGMTQEFLVAYRDQHDTVTMRTPDSFYKSLLPRVQPSKPILFPAGRWIDWTYQTASQIRQRM